MTDAADNGYEVVARYRAEADANQAVEDLVLRGTGAIVERQAHEAPFALLVVNGQADRAREVLGLPPVTGLDVPIEKPARPQMFWVIVIFLAALIILPLIGFY